LENYAYNLKNQVSDKEQLGGRLQEDDKKTLLEACKDILAWLDQYSGSASVKEFEEQKEKLSQVAYPITTKLYSGASDHDEL
jgi:endoplasmic reticulum chaperone BiP